LGSFIPFRMIVSTKMWVTMSKFLLGAGRSAELLVLISRFTYSLTCLERFLRELNNELSSARSLIGLVLVCLGSFYPDLIAFCNEF
jgi:hypothetical protein